jgi:hypothetical protein
MLLSRCLVFARDAGAAMAAERSTHAGGLLGNDGGSEPRYGL